MGNSNGRQSGASSPRHPPFATHHIRTFDGGSLSPHGIYPGTSDYNPTHVLKLIRERRLAPFYKGLDDYEDEWTDYQLSCFVRDGKLPPTAEPPSPMSSPRPPSNSSTPSLHLSPDDLLRPPTPTRARGMSVVENGQQMPDSPTLGATNKDKRGRPRAQTTGSSSVVPTRASHKPLEAVIYRGAIECPVCFLFYPPNINRTRCCWKPICTECFVEMKRAEPHYPSTDDTPATPPSSNLNLNPMNLISDPVRCPFCVKENFGIVYNPPIWLPDARQDAPPREIATSPLHSDNEIPLAQREEMYPPAHERVVLIDNIRPDWYQALAHRRRVEARRLATATALQQALAVAGQRRRSGNRAAVANTASSVAAVNDARRLGRRVDGMIRITRDEADEMMLQEAIRQSIQSEEDAQQKREEEERKKAGTLQSADQGSMSPSTSPTDVSSIPLTSSSPITAPVLPRLQPSTSTSPPGRSFFAAFRSSPPKDRPRQGSTPSLTNRRPSSTTNLYPPSPQIRRQPSLPDALLTSSSSSTSASLATAMHDSIVPSDSRPSISSPLASQPVQTPDARSREPTPEIREFPPEESASEIQRATSSGSDTVGSLPNATSVSTTSTVDDEISPLPMVRISQDSGIKRRDDDGSIEEREIVASN